MGPMVYPMVYPKVIADGNVVAMVDCPYCHCGYCAIIMANTFNHVSMSMPWMSLVALGNTITVVTVGVNTVDYSRNHNPSYSGGQYGHHDYCCRCGRQGPC